MRVLPELISSDDEVGDIVWPGGWWLVLASAASHLTSPPSSLLSAHLSPFANHQRSEQSRTAQPGLAWLCLTLAVIDHGSGCGGPAQLSARDY